MPITVTVTDHAASETHTAPQTYNNLFDAKDEAAHLLHGIYRDAPEDVTTAVENLIGRINTQRGTVILRDDFLDCTVEVIDYRDDDDERHPDMHTRITRAKRDREDSNWDFVEPEDPYGFDTDVKGFLATYAE